MAAPRYDITVERGVTFSLANTWTDGAGAVVALGSGYTARMEVREGTPDSPGDVVDTLTDGGGITLASAAPNFTIALTPTETRAYTAGRTYCYDFRLYHTASGAEYRLLYGAFQVLEQVTAPS